MLKTIFIYGVVLGLLVFLISSAEYIFWIKLNYLELYMGIIAILFLVLGLWFGKKNILIPQKTQIEEQEFNQNELGISKREFDVLTLVSKGLSNQEIADALFVSTNTIKTHTSNIFEKLEVKNRTQAIIKAKNLGLIA
jgi:NarL family two-component system response regulator LiaR